MSVIRLHHSPPSTNNLFVNAAKRGRVKTAAYRAWIEAAGWDIKAANPTVWKEPVYLTIIIGKLRSNADVSNHIKAIEDLLVLHKVIPDDNVKWVRGVSISIAEEPFNGAEISITPAIYRDIDWGNGTTRHVELKAWRMEAG